MNKRKVVAVSGGFDPIHIGHIELFRRASELGELVVIVNSDDFLMNKKGFVFMTLNDRMEIIRSIRYVDRVVACIDKDQTVCETLRMLKPDYFVNGGDRTRDNIPEVEVCKEIGCEMVFGMGEKIRSSSSIVGNVYEKLKGIQK